jgi:hypothetical protein
MNVFRKPLIASAALFLFGALAATPPVLAGDSSCLKAAHSNDGAKSYRAVMTSTRGARSIVETIDIVKPDRMDESGPGHEMVAIGHSAWMREGSGPWKKLPGMDVGDLLSTASTTKFESNSVSCVDNGMGLWHGQPAHMFTGTNNSPHGLVRSKLYLMGDGYIHHLETSTSSGGIQMDFSEFNSASVSAPS